MSQVKEPYGLVYNTDGSLCVTYRDDDIPFAGVRSFAVEEATTNLFTNPRLLNNGSGWMPPSPTAWVDSSGEYPYIHCEQQFDGVYQMLSLSAATYTLTYLVKHKSGSNKIGSHFDGTPTMKIRVDGGEWIDGNLITVPSDGNWHLVEIQATYTTAGSYRVYLQPGRGVTAVSEFYFKYAQIEQKSYPTSFVDGSRSTGIVAIPVNFDLNDEDWVVSFWHKMTNTYSFTNRIIFSIDENFHLNTYSPSVGKYNWVCVNTDNVIFRASSTTTVDTNWNFIVLVKNGSNFKVYINGIPEINLNYTGTLKYNVNNFKFGNFKIGELGYVSHSLFSNIFIGKYRKPNGEIIWTDDYIREVYEAKIPFPVSNKLSIY